uniref:PHD-type domain-containing protein n=1 Tax=Brassica oleracea var. oleracea TaxID=109376 RepID=A0A0D3EFZ6_BRAOL
MESVGKVVRKEIDGVGFCFGTVQSYDPSGFYEIVYENGVTETSSLTEFAALLVGEGQFEEAETPVQVNGCKRSRKRPRENVKRYSKTLPNEVNVMRDVDLNEEIPEEDAGVSDGGLRGNLDLNRAPVETLDLDLNTAVPEPDEGIGYEKNSSNKRRRLIDLNMDASCDLEDAEVRDLNADEREGWFDLNVAADVENSNADVLVQMNGDGEVQETNVQDENGVQDDLEAGGFEEVHVAEVSSGQILEEIQEENTVSAQDLKAPDANGSEGDHDVPEHNSASLPDLNAPDANGTEGDHDLPEHNNVSPQDLNAPDANGVEGDHDLPERNNVSPQDLNAPDANGTEGDHVLPEHNSVSLQDLNALDANGAEGDHDLLERNSNSFSPQDLNAHGANGAEGDHVLPEHNTEGDHVLPDHNSVSPQDLNAPDANGAEGEHHLPDHVANSVDKFLSDRDHYHPVSSTVTACLADEVSPALSVNCLTAEKNWIVEEISLLPPKPQLPPSSPNLNLDGLPIPYVFATYSFLRSFSTVLFLSPFELKDFVEALRFTSPSLLFDSIHVSLLQMLRKDLEKLAGEDDQSATLCLRSLDWDMLDVVNYPLYVVEYLLFSGSKDGPGVDLTRFNFFRNEYFRLPMALKTEILACLCGDMMDAEVVISELNKRSAGGSFDRNVDECFICKMVGNLVCCDGCPAAYHSKCIGVALELLPEGVWYCPECSFDRHAPGLKPAKQIRGSQLIEIDPHGRKYYSSCGYLLVIDSDGSGSANYYHANGVMLVLEQLKSCGSFYVDVTTAIKKHWNIPVTAPLSAPEKQATSGVKNRLEETSRNGGSHLRCHRTLREISDSATEPDILNMSSEGSAETANNGLDVMEEPNMMNTREEVRPNAQSESGYRNQYIFAQLTTAISEEMARNSPDRANDMRFDEEIASTQLKTILMKANKFQWRSIQGLYLDAWKEKCGWCHSCKFGDAGREKICFFNMSLGALRGPSESEIANSQPIDNKSHFMAIITQLLSMESRLQGLLVGPWLNPQHSSIWREHILKASSMYSLRHSLVEFEANLHHLVLSPQWLNHVDSAVEMGSSKHVLIASTRSSSKTTIGKRRGTSLESGVNHTTAKNNGGSPMCWWRGGRLSRQLFNWKVLPRSLVSNAARQGGSVNIPGIMYPTENSEPAKRSRRVAWEAAVESSTTSEQLGFQVRTLHSHIKWDDIENSHLLLASDNESKKSARLFKKVIVRRKCIEEETVKYLLDFGQKRSISQSRYIPDVVLKNGRMIEESSGERREYWLNESYVPLHLLKGFEERKAVRKTSNPGGSFRHPEIEKVRERSSERKGFSCLFERAERSESSLCEQCKEHVPLSDAAWCHICKKSFHKDHIRRADEEGMYICLPCKRAVLAEEQPIVQKRRRPAGSQRNKTGARTQKRKTVIPARNSLRLKAGRISFRVKKHKKAVATKPLRRSGRQTKQVVRLQDESQVPGGSEKRKLETEGDRGSAKKARQENSKTLKRKERCSTYWLNGLRLSREPGDERINKFRRDGCSKPLKNSGSVQVRGECRLCGSMDSESGSTLIACEKCEKWYHGDACGINEKNSSMVIEFRCHICREKPSPSCPPM